MVCLRCGSIYKQIYGENELSLTQLYHVSLGNRSCQTSELTQLSSVLL